MQDTFMKSTMKYLMINKIDMTEIVKAETKSFWKEYINELLAVVKECVESKGLAYTPWKHERGRAKNFFDSKFTDFRTQKLQQVWVLEAVKYLINWSKNSDFRNKNIYNAETLYKHYTALYNDLITSYEKQKGLTIDLSYWTKLTTLTDGTSVFRPKDWIPYTRLFVKVDNKITKEYWILLRDLEVIDYAKSHKKQIIALWWERFSPAWVFATEEYYRPVFKALPYKPKQLTKKDKDNRAKTTQALKDLRQKKKREISKELENQKVDLSKKYATSSSTLDITSDREQELLNNLNKNG